MPQEIKAPQSFYQLAELNQLCLDILTKIREYLHALLHIWHQLYVRAEALPVSPARQDPRCRSRNEILAKIQTATETLLRTSQHLLNIERTLLRLQSELR